MENIENEVRAIGDGEYIETVLETERFPATVWPKKAKGKYVHLMYLIDILVLKIYI